MKNLICVNSNWFTAKDYSKILYSAYLIFVLPLMIFHGTHHEDQIVYALICVGERIAKQTWPSQCFYQPAATWP